VVIWQRGSGKEYAMEREKDWSYKDMQIHEGLKPGSRHFQYFYVISKAGEKRCNYCVWIEDEALSRFAASKDFHEIASSHRDKWAEWVQTKIDSGDFRNVVLKFEKTGQKEIDLSEMGGKLTFD
jgi:hypothetical protein